MSFLDKNLFIIITLFVLSLGGAYILFKVLKATAIIKNEKFQAGGALAGFVILYFTMFQSYENLQKISDMEDKLKTAQGEIDFLRKNLISSQISGKVVPPGKDTQIILAVKQTNPDESGQFRLSANCIDPQTDDIKVFLLSENGYKFKNIFSREEMREIQFNN